MLTITKFTQFTLGILSLSTCFATTLPKELLHWQNQNKIPATAISINNSDGIYTASNGTIAKTSNQAVVASNYFQIGSISKSFIAASILNLEQNGKLNINDTLGKYLKNYPRWSNITLRQLMNMTSGIYNYTDALPIMGLSQAQQQKIYQPEELISIAYKHPENFKAGKSWGYSNTNYVLLGIIIEQITHQALSITLAEQFFVPLGLKHTEYVGTGFPSTTVKHIVHGYRDNKDITSLNLSSYAAAGAIVSTSEDVAKWFKLLMSGHVLAKQQQQELMTTVAIGNHAPKPATARFGLGVYEYNSPIYGKIWWYQGVTEGYIGFVGYLPNQEISFAILTNKRNSANINYFMPDNTLMQKLVPQITLFQTPKTKLTPHP